MLFGGTLMLNCLCCDGSSLVASLALGLSKSSGPDEGPHHPNHFYEYMNKEAPGYTVVVIANAVLELLFGVVFVVCGFGLLAMHRWARWAALLFAVLVLLWQIAKVAYHMILANRPLDNYRLNTDFGGLPFGFLGASTGIQGLAGILMLLLTGVFVVIVVVMILLPATGRAFAARGAAAKPQAA
jgi:hypothetical protein